MTVYNYQSGEGVEGGGWDLTGLGLKAEYVLASQEHDGWGLMLEAEVLVDDEGDRSEAFFSPVFSKSFGDIEVLWAPFVNAEWAGLGEGQAALNLGQTLSVNYHVNESFSAGLGLLHDMALEEWQWSKRGEQRLYAGPVFGYQLEGAKFWMGISPMMQVSDVVGAPDFLLAFSCGLEF